MLIEVDEAIDRVLKGVTTLGKERVSLQLAAGRVLAEDLVAARPMPAFSYSAMDGYAVRASFFEGDGPWTLAVRGESRAGHAGPQIAHGTACRIFTGAAIPDQANAVVIQENVTRNDNSIQVVEKPREGQNIRPAGADLAAGTIALRAGTPIRPGTIGLIGALDRAHVVVARRPIVTILSTGDELRPPGVVGSPTSIPESNSLVLSAIIDGLGGIARVTPFVADDADTTEMEIRNAVATSDLLVTVGGASVGDHDLVRPAMERVGVNIQFWGMLVKPGKPTGFGTYQRSKVLALPGNPASATLTFSLLGAPLLRAMQGQTQVRVRANPMRIIGSHRRRPGRREYLRARFELHDGELCAVLPTGQSSGAVKSFAEADGLVVLEANTPNIDNGDRLPVIRISELWR